MPSTLDGPLTDVVELVQYLSRILDLSVTPVMGAICSWVAEATL